MALLALLLSGVASAAEPLKWDVPHSFMSVAVPGEMESLGVPLRVTAVRSKDSIEVLFDHFLALFQKSDLYVPPREGQFMPEGGLSLTGLDVDRQVSYTVIFQPMPDGTTTVLLGEADLYRRRPPGDDGTLPVFPGARELLRSRTEATTNNLSYSVSASPDDVLAFYRERLGRAGFKLADRDAPITFVRGGDSVQLHLLSGHAPGELSVTLFALHRAPGTEEEAAPGPPSRPRPSTGDAGTPRP